ncbi:MAG TPA: hypothetical protein VJ841_04390 [Candidatus Saccharimonadales bacterium]|nr:hypothetical protein [Candidatus Saccharimonadales bacterium]
MYLKLTDTGTLHAEVDQAFSEVGYQQAGQHDGTASVVKLDSLSTFGAVTPVTSEEAVRGCIQQFECKRALLHLAPLPWERTTC